MDDVISSDWYFGGCFDHLGLAQYSGLGGRPDGWDKHGLIWLCILDGGISSQGGGREHLKKRVVTKKSLEMPLSVRSGFAFDRLMTESGLPAQ